jgi:hypothetical protein
MTSDTTRTASTKGSEAQGPTQSVSSKADSCRAEASESDQFTATIIKNIYGQIRRGIMTSDEKRELKVRIGGLLLEKREELKHGQFVLWVTQHMPFSLSTAYGFMRLKKLADTTAPKEVQLDETYRPPKWARELDKYLAIGQRQNKANQQPGQP